MQDADESLLEEMRDVVESSLARLAEEGVTEPVLLQRDLHDDIAAFVYDRLRRRPMILPVVVEV
jgi:ribonuclease J